MRRYLPCGECIKQGVCKEKGFSLNIDDKTQKIPEWVKVEIACTEFIESKPTPRAME